jgi:hypothetical protein
MADRKPFLLRIDGSVLEAVRRWADDDLRSLNGQIEFLLRSSLARARRRVDSREADEGEESDASEMQQDAEKADRHS